MHRGLILASDKRVISTTRGLPTQCRVSSQCESCRCGLVLIRGPSLTNLKRSRAPHAVLRPSLLEDARPHCGRPPGRSVQRPSPQACGNRILSSPFPNQRNEPVTEKVHDDPCRGKVPEAYLRTRELRCATRCGQSLRRCPIFDLSIFRYERFCSSFLRRRLGAGPCS